MSRSYKKLSTTGFACDNHGETSDYYTAKRRRDRRTAKKPAPEDDDIYMPNLVTTSRVRHSRKTIHDAYDEPTDGTQYWWRESSGDKKTDPYYKYRRK